MLTAVLVVVALQQPAPPPAPATPPSLPPQVGDTSPFRRLALPTPTLLREGSGRPGPRYWQQRADYTIRASLDTATHTITGSETIRYGQRVTVIALQPTHIFLTPKGLEHVGPRAFGYDLDFRSVFSA